MTETNHPVARPTLPTSLLIGLGATIIFLALFALEISHGMIRENGTLAKSLFAFPPTLLLFWGMLTRQRWALLGARVAAFLGALWFFGWALAAAILRPVDQYGPVWVWIMGVSLVLGSILVAGFLGLGRASTRQHYGLTCPRCQQAYRGVKVYFSKDHSCASCGHGVP